MDYTAHYEASPCLKGPGSNLLKARAKGSAFRRLRNHRRLSGIRLPDHPVAMKQLIAHLKEIGLTTYQARVYVTLLRYGELTASRIARYGNIPSNKCYEAARALDTLGFVTRSVRSPFGARISMLSPFLPSHSSTRTSSFDAPILKTPPSEVKW